MAIPSVVQGLIETKDGKVFELNSPRGVAWVEAIGSFRFEPAGDAKPYTVRKEASGYWYGCRKVAGKVRKKYIGKTSEVSTAKLEEIAEALEVPPVPRVNKVAEVAQEVTQNTQVAEKVAEVAQDRLTALELEVANLRKALEALQEALPGKSEAGDSEELPKVDSKVVEELQNKLSNLKAENEKLRVDYGALLESNTVITKKLDQEVQKLRSQLEQERADREEVETQLSNREKQIEKLRSELATQGERTPQHKLYVEIEELKERNRLLIIKSREERQALQEKISVLEYRDESQSRRLTEKQNRLDELEVLLEGELSDLRQKSAAARELPEAADLLNQLKAKRKKSKADLADLEVILEILEN
jgi:chromosome segregation ATPase